MYIKKGFIDISCKSIKIYLSMNPYYTWKRQASVSPMTTFPEFQSKQPYKP